MKQFKKTLSTLALACGLIGATPVHAEDIKIGLVLPLSGPFSTIGKQILDGVKLYMNVHGDKIGDKKVEILLRDDTGIAPAVSQRAAQELLVSEKVNILAGFGFTPAAFAVAPLSESTKTPMIVMNAATSSITTKSPYIVRTSSTMGQFTAPMAMWAAKNGMKNVITLVSDYGPGHDSEKQFVKTFTENGGNIASQIRMPVQSPDFSPFLQRVKDAKPDAVFLFVPAGEQGVAFIKGYRERGLDKEGIELLSTGDITTEDLIAATGDAAIGLKTSFTYSEAHDSEVNRDFKQKYKAMYPNQRPTFLTVGGYDGMHLIYETLKKTGGKSDGDTFIAQAKGMAWESPRGPISIDPETRDIVQNVYIREVKKVDGLLQNIEFDVVPNFKDPGKEK